MWIYQRSSEVEYRLLAVVVLVLDRRYRVYRGVGCLKKQNVDERVQSLLLDSQLVDSTVVELQTLEVTLAWILGPRDCQSQLTASTVKEPEVTH